MNNITHPVSVFHENRIPQKGHIVVLKISPEALTSCLEFLLSKHIAFEVNYSKEETLPTIPKSEISYKEMNVLQETQKRQPQNTIATEVYEKYISAISTQSLPTLEEIAAEYDISPSKLKTLFQETYGEPLYQAYMKARMKVSAELLKQGYRAVKVSKMVGYGEKSCIKFNKMFQKHFGITPKRYQMNHQNNTKR
jgi:AraC-like DNA-binding protein